MTTHVNVLLVTPHSVAEVTPMIAHQGGWDEILLVLGPIAVIAGLLMLARKRVADVPTKPKAKTGKP